MKNCYQKIVQQRRFDPPRGWETIACIDMHTGGEPLRVITDGLPEILGDGILAKRNYIRRKHDGLRKTLMWEPRGHADMYGCILTEPNDDQAHFGVIFMHNEGYSTMCGHAIIALGKLAVEMGWVESTEPETEILIDAPCGRIKTVVTVHKGKAISTRFHCVPSYVAAQDQKVAVEGLGEISYDLAFGGAYYAYVNADKIGLKLDASNYATIIRHGMKIKQAVINSAEDIRHPFEHDLSFLYGTIFISKQAAEGAHSKNVCVFADGEVDRSPTGSGVSGRMALHFAKGEISIGEKVKIESITGSVFTGSVLEEVDFGPHKAVVPQVEGEAFITGQHSFVIDPDDPFRSGFFLR